MPPIKRRRFLQFVGASALTTLALSQFDIQQQESLDSVLAQSTPRKLALLIGINHYADRSRFAALKGCITDVELQQQLLIYRFGFNPQDIFTLTNEQATRQGILEAFEKHLIEQAQPGDVVVFHFSGYGSQMADPSCKFLDRLQSTLVPADSSLQPHRSVPDITGQTLWLLLTALKTANVTVVIDTHPSSVISNNTWLSSPPTPVEKSRTDTASQLNASEQAYQQQWLKRLGLSPSEFIAQWKTGLPKGMLIESCQRGQRVAEVGFGDFFAGTFTYTLTQYLWQQTENEPTKNAIATIVRDVTRLSATTQTPQFAVQPNSGNENRPLYFLQRQSPPAEAAITRIEGKRVTLWLGGIEPESLMAFTQGAILTLIDSAGNEQG
ncbi:MAG TPA: caspase family protein, partial [Coleofasciculaceae cyanobacterium]